jgi:hypothetical protein
MLITGMQINDPAVVAELTERHAVYEKALIANDVATLDALFWDSPRAVRYGVTENLHGSDEIRAFRQGRPAINLDRTISWLEILAIGDAAGVVNVEFARKMDSVERHGRQTQFWFRFAEGWRIVSAHVSLLPGPSSYLQGAAALLGMPLDSSNRDAVSHDLNRLTEVAKFLMEFPLSQDIEAAPVFRP